MSLYAVNKVLWEIAQSDAAGAAYAQDAEAYLSGRPLDEKEKKPLLDRDLRAIYELGCHPFLLYFYAIRIGGGWSFTMMLDYVKALEGLQLLDIET